MARVLIIEDEISLLEVYADYLKSDGNHQVFSATDGDSGLKLALKGNWDILFLDIMLPKLDGISLLRRLSTAKLLESRTVIMFTNLETEAIAAQSLKLGAKEYLSKADINPQIVLGVVNKYTQKPHE